MKYRSHTSATLVTPTLAPLTDSGERQCSTGASGPSATRPSPSLKHSHDGYWGLRYFRPLSKAKGQRIRSVLSILRLFRRILRHFLSVSRSIARHREATSGSTFRLRFNCASTASTVTPATKFPATTTSEATCIPGFFFTAPGLPHPTSASTSDAMCVPGFFFYGARPFSFDFNFDFRRNERSGALPELRRQKTTRMCPPTDIALSST